MNRCLLNRYMANKYEIANKYENNSLFNNREIQIKFSTSYFYTIRLALDNCKVNGSK